LSGITHKPKIQQHNAHIQQRQCVIPMVVGYRCTSVLHALKVSSLGLRVGLC
jgi:hypothetical protein